jgi:hypothetical protein
MKITVLMTLRPNEEPSSEIEAVLKNLPGAAREKGDSEQDAQDRLTAQYLRALVAAGKIAKTSLNFLLDYQYRMMLLASSMLITSIQDLC